MSDFPYAPPSEAPKVLHADHEILVVDKPAGLLSVPGRGEGKDDCLINRLRGAFPTVLLVHRLDQDTSGVMVVARTMPALNKLTEMLAEREVHRVGDCRSSAAAPLLTAPSTKPRC